MDLFQKIFFHKKSKEKKLPTQWLFKLCLQIMASYFQNIGTIVLTKTFSDTGTQKGKIISVFNGNLTKSGVYGELSFQELNGQALNERRAECYAF